MVVALEEAFKEKRLLGNEGTAPLGKAYAIFAHAGGSGKTTLTRDLGYELALRGFRVLLVDADPQANLTTWLGYDPIDIPDEKTLLRFVETGELPETIRVDLGGGVALDLIPANTNLALAEVRIPLKPSGMLMWRGGLRHLRRDYDFILMDSPPSLGPLAGMVGLAGDGLIVPVETSAKGIQGLQGVLMVAKDYVAHLSSLGLLEEKDSARYIKLIVPTKYDPRTRQDRFIRETLASISEVPIARPFSYRPGPYKRAISEGVPIRALGDKAIAEELDSLVEVFLDAALKEE